MPEYQYCWSHRFENDQLQLSERITKSMHESLRVLAALGIPREPILVDPYGE